MHNQDTAKDDFLEGLLSIFEKLSKQLKLVLEEARENGKKLNELSDDDKINHFSKAMDKVINETDDKSLLKIAETLRQNPKESMRMLHEVVSSQTIDKAKELVSHTKQTVDFLDKMKQNLENIKVVSIEEIKGIERLRSDEFTKLQLAEEILKDLGAFEPEKNLEKSKEQQREWEKEDNAESVNEQEEETDKIIELKIQKESLEIERER